ncbi:hypothetical protein [Zavarzinia sp. CC-PAN008]|uniref:hypothetical protein n=1 Tax=Zavarzinia sp. CC-PAN008 TaxID=3243332 RepID=UPI003F747952
MDRTLSTSFLAALPDAERAAVGQRVRDLIAGTPALSGPVATFPYRTAMHRALRLS